MEEVGCTTPFGFNTENVCIEKENREKAFKIYNSQKNKRNKIEDCQYPCNFIKSWLSVEKFRLNQTSKDFSLNFDKFIKVTKAKYSYTELELLAELGGYVGLFLGLSVFHLSQAFDKILDCTMKD
jgi:hypothetical protein